MTGPRALPICFAGGVLLTIVGTAVGLNGGLGAVAIGIITTGLALVVLAGFLLMATYRPKRGRVA